MRLRLENKIALITAAASGMGRAATLLFASEGATVIAADIDQAALDALPSEASPGRILPRRVDVLVDEDIRAVLAEIDQEFGRLDVLYCHAGGGGGMTLTMDDALWSRLVALNMRSPVFTTFEALPLLRKSQAASIIYTASTAGLVGLANNPCYALAKGGVIAFSRSMAMALAPEGIRVNAICPAVIDTPTMRWGNPPGEPEARKKMWEERVKVIPLGRAGLPSEIAPLALLYASDDASYLTGNITPADGGYTAG
jgi:NAD(P)-dependent dehydrogenase (short-subunit alcohol dehydrogenase family)